MAADALQPLLRAFRARARDLPKEILRVRSRRELQMLLSYLAVGTVCQDTERAMHPGHVQGFLAMEDRKKPRWHSLGRPILLPSPGDRCCASWFC